MNPTTEENTTNAPIPSKIEIAIRALEANNIDWDLRDEACKVLSAYLKSTS